MSATVAPSLHSINCNTGVIPLHLQVTAHQELVEVLDSLPYMALVVNRARQTVFANQALLRTFGATGFDTILGRRPGELLACIQAGEQTGGCGFAEGCRHCQAAMALTACLENGGRSVSEARVSARIDGRLTAYDLRITATPLQLAGERMAIVYFEDISHVKRREHLESIFLHDLLNSIGSLQMLVEMPCDQPLPQWQALFLRQVMQLADEVRAHRVLRHAEQGDLELDTSCVTVAGLLEEVLAILRPLAEHCGVAIDFALPAEAIYLATDPQIARRVIVNAGKNAVEAATAGDRIRIGVQHAAEVAVVTVWNRQILSDEVRHQLFQRSFSTKGVGRGLGTYSMRLLLENYLGGTVRFTSDSTGTTFFLTFPTVESYLQKRS